ncbi:MAG TPA: bifunctional ADP-dependent NAD(P)H-hydrate dehydratase/NAD(P)H-hydrate epimerase [Ruminococcaceae bacterium]|nr:bifunctional ADP-dependent NAD(P)H-hydrate dehydratase/NAD(P)H-hydrate epimerase [Oscillospiraceae bacterium]
MKQIEQNAVSGGLSYLQMMENAGTACAEYVAHTVAHDIPATALIACGKGKNGGDGFVIARILHQLGRSVDVLLVNGQPQADDAKTMFEKMNGISVLDFATQPNFSKEKISSADYIIDAVFGFGFHGEADEQTICVFQAINASKAKVIAVDVPSGVECDSAHVCNGAIQANTTLAISFCKPGHLLYPSAEYCGAVVPLSIGIAESCCDRVDDAGFFTLSRKEIRLPERRAEANKGSFGKVLSVCGSRRYAGAAVFAANGAVKVGAGLVTAAFPDSAYPAIGAKLTEPILMPLPCCTDGFFIRGAIEPILSACKSASVLLLGCGLGQTLGTASLVNEVLPAAECPIVLDADGINLLCGNINGLESIGTRTVFTPHPGEFARLTGKTVPEIQNNRIALAKEFAQRYNTVLVLKGAATVVASPERVYVNPTGNPGMARGGSGDLLAGMIAGLIAQGMSRFDAAVTAVFLHGYVGDRAAEVTSVHGMTPSDMLALLPKVLSDFE